MWTWNLSRPGLSPSRANSISNSISSRSTGTPQTAHEAPTPGPPHVRSGRRLGSFPSWTTLRAICRRTFSSIWLTLGARHRRRVKPGGQARCPALTKCVSASALTMPPLIHVHGPRDDHTHRHHLVVDRDVDKVQAVGENAPGPTQGLGGHLKTGQLWMRGPASSS